MAASAFCSAARPVSVLIIEDDADTAESLARFLRLGCGYTVATAARRPEKGPHGRAEQQHGRQALRIALPMLLPAGGV